MEAEIIFERRMKRRDKLLAQTANKYIELYTRDEKLGELYELHSNKPDESYIDDFLAALKEKIINQLR